MKIKLSDFLDYLIIYWMIAYVFIINWFALITQASLIMIFLVFLRLCQNLKKTLRLSSFYFGLIFSLIYPVFNYINLGGNQNILTENVITIITTTSLFIYVSFICKYKRQFIINFFRKQKYLFNIIMLINIPFLILQLGGNTELSGIHPKTLTNTFSSDLVSGLFGYNGTGFLTMYFCFLIVYNFALYKQGNIKQKKLFIIYNLSLIGFESFVAANSDNKALFVLAPLFLITYIVIFHIDLYKNFLRKAKLLVDYVIKGIFAIVLFFFVSQPFIGTIDQLKEMLASLNYGMSHANLAYGGAERIGTIVYALNNSSIRWTGAGIAKHTWQESYCLGFAHFGINDFGSFLCLGGLLFLILLICFMLSVYRNIFSDCITRYTFFTLTIVVLIYTQLLTALSITCSWTFFVFTVAMLHNKKIEGK